MGNGIPDDWYIHHSGEGMILDQEKVAAERNRLRAALAEIQAYSVGDPRPRHTWYYDRAALALEQSVDGETK